MPVDNLIDLFGSVDLTPSSSSPFDQNAVWDFMDIMATQRPTPEDSSESQNSGSSGGEDDFQSLPVSLSFLESETSLDETNSSDYIIVPRHPSQVVGKEAQFYIESDPFETILIVQVGSPDGRLRAVKTFKDKFHPERLVFSFTPQEFGLHMIYITDDAGGIGQKCFEFGVSRDYKGVAKDVNIFDVKMLGKAWGLAVLKGSDKFYATDRDNNQVLIMDSSGKVMGKFGKSGHGRDEMYRPTGIAIHEESGRLFITDKDNHRVVIYSLNGKYLGSFGRKGYQNGEFSYPWGIAVSPKGDVIVVADSRNHRIQLFDLGGNFLRKYSVFETNPFEFKTMFNYPRGVAFSANGEKIYVTDFNIHSAMVLNLELTERTVLVPANKLQRPQGITVDDVGNILIADSKNHCVRVVSPTGENLETIKMTGSHTFFLPMDIAVLKGGRLVVTDADNRLRIF